MFQNDSGHGNPGMAGTRLVVGPDGIQRLVSFNEKPKPFQLTDKDVSRIWANEELKLRNIHSEPNLVSKTALELASLVPTLGLLSCTRHHGLALGSEPFNAYLECDTIYLVQ